MSDSDLWVLGAVSRSYSATHKVRESDVLAPLKRAKDVLPFDPEKAESCNSPAPFREHFFEFSRQTCEQEAKYER